MINQTEERLKNLSIQIIQLHLAASKKGPPHHLMGQILRSATSACLNFAESKFGQTKRDFVLKMSITLKELSETNMCLYLMIESGVIKDSPHAQTLLQESHELTLIFAKSVKTAQENLLSEKDSRARK